MGSQYTEFTAEKKAAFLIMLEATGLVATSCRSVCITRRTAYNHKGSDEFFSLAWDEAIEASIDALEVEARRRATAGVEEDVYYQGKRIGGKRHHSDNLMMFLLKGKRSEFVQDNGRGDGGGGDEAEVDSFDYEDVTG